MDSSISSSESSSESYTSPYEHLLQGSDTAMVYGFEHCHYQDVKTQIERDDQVRRVYDHTLGYDLTPKNDHSCTRTNGELMRKVNSGTKALIQHNKTQRDQGKQADTRGKTSHLTCKAGLTNFVLENYFRSKSGLPVSPVIFCVDYEDGNKPNPHPLSSENMLSKTKVLTQNNGKKVLANGLVTHSELRRAHKLCFDPIIDPEINAIAQETFKFVKVIRQEFGGKDHYLLEEVSPPWEQPDFEKEYQKRQEVSAKEKKETRKMKLYDWKEDLNRESSRVRKEHYKARTPSINLSN